MKRGRPPFPPGERLTERFELKLRPAQLAEWSALAEDEGVSLNEWIRDACEAYARRS